MEPSENPRQGDDHDHGRRARQLVDQQGGRAGDPGDGPNADSSVEVGCQEQDAQQREQHLAPSWLQRDQAEREA